jgi:hypothetical protein
MESEMMRKAGLMWVLTSREAQTLRFVEMPNLHSWVAESLLGMRAATNLEMEVNDRPCNTSDRNQHD